MPVWLQIIAVVVALVLLAPLVGLAGKRIAPRTGGLALILLGLGAVTDPPKRHMLEAMDTEEDQSPHSGDPPVPTGDPR